MVNQLVNKMLNKDIGIDLGTVNILVYLKGKGIVLNEPSVIVIEEETKRPIAYGTEANEMLGRTPGKIKAIRPMKDGVIADFDMVELLLNSILSKINIKNRIIKPKILICCPSNITEVEKNAIRDAAYRVGAKKVIVEEEPKVAAVGAGLEIGRPIGNMIVDIGGGTTDVAVLSLGEIVTSASIKTAGNTFDEDIINYVKNKYKLLIGEKTAEKIKIEIGTAQSENKKEKLEIKGRDLVGGLPKSIYITSEEIEQALKDSVEKILKVIKMVLEQTPPELSADIIEKGIILTGGGSLLKNLDKYLEENLKIPVVLAEEPLSCVALGTGIMLEKINYIN